MKVVFINPPFKSEYGRFSREQRSPAITKSGCLYYPLWLMYAAALTEKKGNEVALLDAPARRMDFAAALAWVEEHVKTDKVLFVLDTSTPSICSDVDFGSQLKDRYPQSFVLLVGTHPSAKPEETLRLSEKVDAVALREFDAIVVELAATLEKGGALDSVRGLAWMQDGAFRRTEDMPYLETEQLDEIPYAAEFLKRQKEKGEMSEKDYFFPAAHFPSIQIFTGRGCPARCFFCVYPQVMHGHKFRCRSAANVIGEFQYIVDNFPDVKEIVIEDDTFTIDEKRVRAICEGLIARKIHKRIKWLCNARVTLTLETMKAMKKAGCRLLIPGIESANQQILKNIHKGTTEEQILNYVRNARKAGLLIHACYMVGNKGETRSTMQETLDLALKLNTDTAQFFPLIPYPGTEAYDWAKDNGYIVSDYRQYCKEDGVHNTVLNLPGLSSEEMVRFCNDARKRYYLRPRYIMHRLAVALIHPSDLVRVFKAFGTFKKHLFGSK